MFFLSCILIRILFLSSKFPVYMKHLIVVLEAEKIKISKGANKQYIAIYIVATTSMMISQETKTDIIPKYPNKMLN